MKNGDTFGELALLQEGRRRATVVSKTRVQLLTIECDQFRRIFMSEAGVAPRDSGKLPNFIEFLKMQPLMIDFPISRLIDKPEHCVVNFYG
ncbi:unnamed protein product [Protopolystoma xenopodis]|uniref:Cyclic nucleotide-binding domain-containing protein n=1 Tax=Protopolystoma xenopodis TaxID=117903 RepID=A0A3S5CPC3_9PLAT|nr:unnamed protein product [Protopolystoma xenopodis]